MKHVVRTHHKEDIISLKIPALPFHNCFVIDLLALPHLCCCTWPPQQCHCSKLHANGTHLDLPICTNTAYGRLCTMLKLGPQVTLFILNVTKAEQLLNRLFQQTFLSSSFVPSDTSSLF